MKIVIEKIKIKNFKSILDMEIEFNEGENIIKGDNATGKTTIIDAFMWGLFGYDSSGSANFQLKPKTNGEELRKAEYWVELLLNVGGEKYKIVREVEEKYSRPRGQLIEEYKGDTINYNINGTPLTKGEFETAISKIIEKDMFRLLSDPYYFNSLHWEERRKMLVGLIGGVSWDDVESVNRDSIEKYLSDGKSVDNIRKELKNDFLKVERTYQDCEAQISVLKEAKVEGNINTPKKELKAVQDKIDALKKKIESIKQKDLVANKEKTEKIHRLYKEKDALLRLIQGIIEKVNKDINLKNELVSKLSSEIRENEYYINNNKKRIIDISENMELLGDKFDAIRIQEIKDVCPICGSKIEVDKEGAEKIKVDQLKAINTKGVQLKEQKEQYEKDILRYEKTNKSLENKKELVLLEIGDLKAEMIESTGKIQEVILKNENQVVKVEKSFEKADTSKIEDEVKVLRGKETELQISIAQLLNNKKLDEKIKDKESLKKSSLKDYRDIDVKILVLESYVYQRSNLIEERVNELFSGNVGFHLFRQLKGGDYKMICETAVNGVFYSDVNYAGKVQAGLEIIKVFSDKNQINCPIFIDNRESISVIPELENQVINLYKVEGSELLINK